MVISNPSGDAPSQMCLQQALHSALLTPSELGPLRTGFSPGLPLCFYRLALPKLNEVAIPPHHPPVVLTPALVILSKAQKVMMLEMTCFTYGRVSYTEINVNDPSTLE